MANDAANLAALLNSLSPQNMRDLEGALKRARTSGMNIFEKARKASIDGFFAAKKIFHDTHVNPDYHYEHQEFPKVLYCVLETEDGPQIGHLTVQSEDEAEGYGPEWCANPGLAQRYYNQANSVEPEPVHKRGPGRPRKPQEGEFAHAHS